MNPVSSRLSNSDLSFDFAESDNREATATIRGYTYQFEATIIEILNADEGSYVTVEGLEDFDIYTSTTSELFQCKYLSSKKLTNSVIRDAAIPMYTGFIKNDLPKGIVRNYTLYGHFKECNSETISKLSPSELCDAFNSGRKSNASKGILSPNNNQLELFSKRFFIKTALDYYNHKTKATDLLRDLFSVSDDEAHLYLYPTAFTYISDIASRPDKEDRKIDRKRFFEKVKPSRALYNAWSIREKGEINYCHAMRKRYFSIQNIDGRDRLFILNLDENCDDGLIVKTLLRISEKWSSHLVRRKPDHERYAPYVYLPHLLPSRLAEIKSNLRQLNVSFVDGHPFLDSPFDFDFLSKSQTFENRISLRFVNSDDDLAQCVKCLRPYSSLFDFHMGKSTPIPSGQFLLVSIPITTIGMVQQII